MFPSQTVHGQRAGLELIIHKSAMAPAGPGLLARQDHQGYSAKTMIFAQAFPWSVLWLARTMLDARRCRMTSLGFRTSSDILGVDGTSYTQRNTIATSRRFVCYGFCANVQMLLLCMVVELRADSNSAQLSRFQQSLTNRSSLGIDCRHDSNGNHASASRTVVMQA